MSGLPAFRRLAAVTELRLSKDSNSLLPYLLARGVSQEDAIALAGNAALLFRAMAAEPPFSSPGDVLRRLSLGEIAEYCELYGRVLSGEIEYGEAAT